MISKIIKIINIGKFKNFNSVGDLTFKKYTLIFGPNKHGKTTFTSIVKSLKSGDKNSLIGRKTFGSESKASQEYEILIDSTKHSFNSALKCENFEIFDNDFIHINVFAGNSIGKENRSNLYSILLDEQNIKLKSDIDELERKQSLLTTEKNNAKNAIQDFQDFIKLEAKDKISDIEVKVQENNNKATQFVNQAKLKILCEKTNLHFNFDDFEKKLKQTIDTTLESKVNEHIKNYHKHGSTSKDFLRKGVDLVTNSDNCPFCSQSLIAVSEKINVLKTFFSTTYKEIQESINDSMQQFTLIGIEGEINAFKLCGLEFENTEIEKIKNSLISVIEYIKTKQIDLSKDIKIEENEDYLFIKNELTKIKNKINKVTFATVDSNTFNVETTKLLLNKSRFSTEGVEKYTNYKEKEKAFEENKKQIDEKNIKLKLDLNSLFQTHLVKINEVLEISGANFKLKKLDPNTNRNLKDHMCEYSLVFDDMHDVDLDGDNNYPSFKNTLSDSDKRVLAFAFFIAKINAEKNIKDKIIILDDPFTSLDEDRKDSMINLVKDLQCEQIIVLSHNHRFVGRCFKFFPSTETKTLKLHTSDLRGSEFQNMDVQQEILDSDIEKDLNYIRMSIRDNSRLKEACQKVRPCIEQILKEKYSDIIKPDSLSGNSSISKFLDDIGDKCPAKRDIEGGYWHDDHHAQNPIDTADDTERLTKLKHFIKNILPAI